MILSYIYNILKFKKWELFFLITIVISLKWSTIIILRPDINYLTELHKCPTCFGTSACDYIHEVDITFRDFYSAFSYYFGVKNVFFGTFNTSKVILKKLAQSFELNEFDRMLCENVNFSYICPMNTEKTDNQIDVNFYKLIEKQVSLSFTQDHFSRLRLCPNVRHLNDLLHPIYFSNKNVDSETLDINIWTLTVLNPEPLFLQILSADKNWPVPKYFGACGRIIIEEYVGLPLTAYYNEPWLNRAKIASSLLNAAHTFTYGNENFGFYLTDISADNIAVDLKYNAKFIDLENVIIVDKNLTSKEKPPKWNELHVNADDLSCPECLVFSSVEICNHKISDHNYYAIYTIVTKYKQ
uniref:divergent protein kinase domain 2A isoform X2 n=1 Tax=Osmia lignaria TaxID=473952 RepID=UPI001478C6F2|nr:divergent protein kinase domain 2A isoform X2 [Osmia lignaria]